MLVSQEHRMQLYLRRYKATEPRVWLHSLYRSGPAYRFIKLQLKLQHCGGKYRSLYTKLHINYWWKLVFCLLNKSFMDFCGRLKKPFQKYHLVNCTESRYQIKAWWRLPVSQKLGCNYFAYVKCNRAQSENKLLFACFTNLFDNIQCWCLEMLFQK